MADKNLIDYLLKVDKEYKFKIKIAGILEDEECLEKVLSKFGVISLTGPKTSPVLKEPIDFPNYKNIEITTFEVTLQYPTTQFVLSNEISSMCGLAKNQVIVRAENEVAQEYCKEENNKAILTDPNYKDDKPVDIQNKVGEERKIELLNHLPKTENHAPKGEKAEDFNKGIKGSKSPNSESLIKSRWNKIGVK